ncbi:type II secretion system protein [Desulfitobacterium sp. Sab5]|uniref:type II secretion system protein n=1 Tax=Desulfitobacterium nosdiversum TaxID=3375356 RepID=UPI003CFB5B25
MTNALINLKKNKKGFTLVELVVVIAIIGILATILVPRFIGYTDDAREKATISEAKNIRTIADTYYAKNGSWPTVTKSGSTYKVGDNATAFDGVIKDFVSGVALDNNVSLTSDGSFKYTKNSVTAIVDAAGTITH